MAFRVQCLSPRYMGRSANLLVRAAEEGPGRGYLSAFGLGIQVFRVLRFRVWGLWRGALGLAIHDRP